MANQDYGIEEANQLVEEGKIDLIMIGRPFIYNPVCRYLQIQ
jgi:2,4-dienoyl-CoA reductase-like NADH-dependent reductase (Old Yellow Enzyme family)